MKKKQKPSVYSEQHVRRFGSTVRKYLRLGAGNRQIEMPLSQVERAADAVTREIQDGRPGWRVLEPRVLRQVCRELAIEPENFVISEFLRGAPVARPDKYIVR